MVVEFGQTIDPSVHDRVLAFDAEVTLAALPGVIETVPTYRSLMIHYDPRALGESELIGRLGALGAAGPSANRPVRRWSIPACYEPPHSEDLAECAAALGLTPERVVALHSAAVFRVYMYGFAPGFLHMGGLPDELFISRRVTPRLPVPSGALIIANGQAVVTTYNFPTGWYMLGRTPTLMFDPAREPSFLIGVGDEVVFEPVDSAAFGALSNAVAAGDPVLREVAR